MALDAATGEVRAMLQAWRGGDLAARDRLFDAFYPDLKLAAAAMLRGERGTSLSSRDLVHESVMRLVALDRIDWQDRSHFMALASRMMRRALIDHARSKHRAKREHQRVELQTSIADVPSLDLEDLTFALDRLASIDPQRAEIVEMRFFGGMEITDIAAVLSLSESTVKRRWVAARLWLFDALEVEHP